MKQVRAHQSYASLLEYSERNATAAEQYQESLRKLDLAKHDSKSDIVISGFRTLSKLGIAKVQGDATTEKLHEAAQAASVFLRQCGSRNVLQQLVQDTDLSKLTLHRIQRKCAELKINCASGVLQDAFVKLENAIIKSHTQNGASRK